MDNLRQHAFDVLSQLFQQVGPKTTQVHGSNRPLNPPPTAFQVDFDIISGFSYISNASPAFTALSFLKFGRDYLNGALADDQLQAKPPLIETLSL